MPFLHLRLLSAQSIDVCNGNTTQLLHNIRRQRQRQQRREDQLTSVLRAVCWCRDDIIWIAYAVLFSYSMHVIHQRMHKNTSQSAMNRDRYSKTIHVSFYQSSGSKVAYTQLKLQCTLHGNCSMWYNVMRWRCIHTLVCIVPILLYA